MNFSIGDYCQPLDMNLGAFLGSTVSVSTGLAKDPVYWSKACKTCQPSACGRLFRVQSEGTMGYGFGRIGPLLSEEYMWRLRTLTSVLKATMFLFQ